jgi:predicted nuclease of predicted toxin-antitoxin system
MLSIGMDDPSISDAAIMKIAIEEERTILTFDKDYGEPIFRHNYQPPNGVIFLRLEEYEPVQPGHIIEEIITNTEIDFARALIVVDKNGLRQRKY